MAWLKLRPRATIMGAEAVLIEDEMGFYKWWRQPAGDRMRGREAALWATSSIHTSGRSWAVKCNRFRWIC